MKYLLFKLINKESSYAIVSPKILCLLDDSAYAKLKNSGNQDILKEVKQIEKAQISKLVGTKRKKEVVVYDLNDNEFVRLNFEVTSIYKQFIDAFPHFKREVNDSEKRIHPINALLVMLFAYSFIWAGTRPPPSDINSEGIRLKLAYFNVQFLEWLNDLIGQKLILGIGIILFITLFYFVFRPEWSYLFGREKKYANRIVAHKKMKE